MKMTKEQQQLVENNHDLIYGCAKFYGIDLEEYSGLLSIGLCKAAMDFDETKGKFSTLAYKYMYQEFMNHLSSTKVDKRKANILPYSLNQNNNDDIEPEDTLSKYNFDYFELMEELKTILNSFELEVVELLMQDKLQSQVALELNITQQYITQIKKRIATKLIKKGVNII